MRVYRNLHEIPKQETPYVFSLGSYDGIHLGHQHILNTLVSSAKSLGAKSCVLTYTNHPTWALKNRPNKRLLITPSHKEMLLESLGIDTLVHIPFTESFSKLTAEEFFSLILSKFQIKKCVFGKDTCIGNNRAGNESLLKAIGEKNRIEISCLERIGNYSSSEIRKHIENGELNLAQKLLGRPYSIYDSPISGYGIGANLGYPTINLSTENLTLPPLGVYISECRDDNMRFPSITNIGYAPTLKTSDKISIETHLLNDCLEQTPKRVEVSLLKFVRKEIHFQDKEALKAQIKKDTFEAQSFFTHR